MKIRLQDSPVVVEAREGESLLLACARGGIVFSAPCGGRHRCGKCRVRLLEGHVTGDTPDGEGWVRACMAQPLSDIVIACPENIVIINSEVAVPVRSSKRHPVRAGVALDIGTTTISAKLVDLDASSSSDAASSLDAVSELNDQRVFGADIMSRIGAAREGRTGELFAAINSQTERILKRFMERWELQRIERLSVSGNTTMLHLFLNVDPGGMGEVPFTPAFLEGREMKGAALSLSAEDVMVLPSVSAFVGGDITAGMAVLDLLNADVPSLLVDIGTNGEMALFTPGERKILCCSTAAGPAFEGAEISCGLGGIPGAISAVELVNGSFSISTIGNAAPRGICGSGLIDAVAVMLKQGIVDETGAIDKSYRDGYKLSEGVSISGKDIRQFQLGKSAILSGIRILCKNARLSLGEIKNVYIAGGFGFFINRNNAVAAGLFPKEFIDRITVCGNLSLQGAEASLTEKDFNDRCGRIINSCSVIDLSMDPAFMDEFAENMLFD